MMDHNDDLTIAARVKQWDIFAPDWTYLAQFPALELGPLCALSVGLHPYFASPGWVLHVAKPHFAGTDSDEVCPLEDAAAGAKRATQLHEFLQRVHVAVANLEPLGTLPIADGAPILEKTMVKVADFAAWTKRIGWKLPADFPRPFEAGDSAISEELQAGGATKWPWGNHETNLLRMLVAAAERFWKLYDADDPSTAPTNKQVIDWLTQQSVSPRIAGAMATILRADGLRVGPRK